MGNFDAGKFGAIFAIPFSKANITTEQSNTDLVLVGGNTLAVMPGSGSVVGISCRLSAAITAGTLAVKSHKDGTEFADQGAPALALSSAAGSSQESYASVRPGVCKFSADEGVGVSYTSSTDMAPTNTNDVDALLFVQLDAD